MGKRYIRASEIGSYLYCRRAWWFKRVAKLEPDDDGRLHAGELAHARHGQMLHRSQIIRKIALLCFGAALLFLALALLLPFM